MEGRFVPRSPLGERLVEHRAVILQLAAARHASNVRLFGSVARGSDRPDSDVDLLVDLARDAEPPKWHEMYSSERSSELSSRRSSAPGRA